MIPFTLVVDTTIKDIANHTTDFKKGIYEQNAIYDNTLEEIRDTLEDSITRDKNLILTTFDNLEIIPEEYLTVITKPEDARISRDDYLSSFYYRSELIPLIIKCEFDDKKFIRDIRRKKRNERGTK